MGPLNEKRKQAGTICVSPPTLSEEPQGCAVPILLPSTQFRNRVAFSALEASITVKSSKRKDKEVAE